jgi:hypothetical protein
VPRELTVEAFVAAFVTVGYEVCDDGEYENGWEKVALYVNAQRVPQHMARQVNASQWTSKLGPCHDILHTLPGVAGKLYGTVHLFMKRRKK